MQGSLTNEQRGLVESCIRLANFLAWKAFKASPGFMDIGDLRCAAYDGLMIAARCYDPAKGNFASFAGIKIKWQIIAAKRARIKRPAEISIDAPSQVSPEQCLIDGGNILSTIQAPTIDLDTRIMLDQAISKLGIREQEAIGMELKGHTLQEIGDAMGFSKEYARQLTDRAKRAMRQNISREDIVF